MKFKRILILLLVLITMMLTFFITVIFADAKEEAASSPTDTNSPTESEIIYMRYYFYADERWFNEYADTIGIYWWEGTGACDEWPGYEANKADAENVYYYDVPFDVKTIIWNNYLFGADDPDLQLDSYEMRTSMVGVDGDFDSMIAVPQTEWIDNFDQYWPPCDWYYYYGDGCYGATKYGGIMDCEREDHDHGEIGDVDRDGKLSIFDVSYIQRAMAQFVELSDDEKQIADVSRDNEITVLDISIIQYRIARKAISAE